MKMKSTSKQWSRDIILYQTMNMNIELNPWSYDGASQNVKNQTKNQTK